MKKFVLITFVFIAFMSIYPNILNVKAESLNDVIDEQLEKIDLDDLIQYFENQGESNFYEFVLSILNGKINVDYNSVFEYFFNVFLVKIKDFLPILTSILTITIFCGLVNSVKGSFFSEQISSVIFFICLLSIIVLLCSQVALIFNDVSKSIINMGKLSEIVLPILITLMIGAGGTVSATVFTPTVALLSTTIINIFINILLPFIIVGLIFSVFSNISDSIKLKKFSEFFNGIVKWIIGICVTVFSLFLTINGIASAGFDGISIKTVKYAISNSIPMIGGFLKDGVDLVVAGSILIKNSVGIATLVFLFYNLISPVIQIICFNTVLKLIISFVEPISDGRITDLCSSVSKGVTMILVCLLFVAFMFFITIILMVLTANSFI